MAGPDPDVAAAVAEAGLSVVGPADSGLGVDGGLVINAPLHSSKVRALAQRPGFNVSPSGPNHSVVWRRGWRPFDPTVAALSDEPVPDPVEVLARHFQWTGDLGSNERSIRAALAELVAGPWKLVQLYDPPPGGLTDVAVEWTP